MNLNPIADIIEICFSAAQPLLNVYNQGIKSSYSFEIDMGNVEDYNHVDIRYAKNYESLFQDLMKIKGPVLYWFEWVSEHSSHEILDAFECYKDSPECKAIPALKSKPEYGTKVLYVGKVKAQFWGRFITHLGFYKTNKTQGVQLFYWAKPLGLQLSVHVFEFDNDMADLMTIVEFEMAKKLKPLLGKHK